MTFLLDTNVVSELIKPQPDSNVTDWLEATDEDRLFISVVTIAEIRYGIDRLPESKRKTRLNQWCGDELVCRFEGRIVSIDLKIAEEWGSMMANADKNKRAIDSLDAFIAASSKVHQLVLATRNIRDFEELKISLFNPWKTT